MNKNITMLRKHSALRLVGLLFSTIGLSVFLAALFGYNFTDKFLWLTFSLLTVFLGIVLVSIHTNLILPGVISQHGVYYRSLSNRGVLGWIVGIVLSVFYIVLYWFPESLGFYGNTQPNSGFVALFDPLSYFFKNEPASQWFMYGSLYTLFILAFGIRYLFRYKHNRYQIFRTLAVMAAQLFLAFLIPEILESLNSKDEYYARDIKFFWPLNHYFFEPWHLNNMLSGGSMGMVFLIWGIFGFLVIVPLLTYFWGKRWYCSWVCGCGALAETAGDYFRHLSDKRVVAWQIERILIHGVLLVITVVTGVVLYGYFSNAQTFLGLSIYTYFSKPYGFLIGSIFAGVVGVGFYPFLGSRVWCRFGCPLAAYMGIIQRFFSRYRITTNGGQCMSCGNCSTYCEMGIDVRAYAQKGQNIVRASCVGCGICSEVCPRGVLKLENGSLYERIRSKID